MHSIEFTGHEPHPWHVPTDDGTEWDTATEGEAALSLTAFILSRDEQARPEPEPLAEGLIYI